MVEANSGDGTSLGHQSSASGDYCERLPTSMIPQRSGDTRTSAVKTALSDSIRNQRRLTRDKLGNFSSTNLGEEISGDKNPPLSAREGFLAEALYELLQNAISVGGLAAFISGYVQVFMQEWLLTVEIVVNLFFTVIGLTIFGIGLRQGLMPLGELVGSGLPRKVSRPTVLMAIGVLGILCTIAEPAIGALRQAGKNTNEKKAPLLKNLLNQPTVLMVTVGMGVGCAAVVGCLRLTLDLKIKPMLYATCIPAIVITLICVVGMGGSMTTVTGLAWDCGAVTTGPVTVPIVLALGIGVAAASKTTQQGSGEKERQKMRGSTMLNSLDPIAPSGDPKRDLSVINETATRQSSAEAAAEDEQDLSGFGIVTFASLFPVLSVWVLCLQSGGPDAEYDKSLQAIDVSADDGGLLTDMLSALRNTLQAIIPLVGFLLALLLGLIGESPEQPKVMAFGIGYCCIGMFIFDFGLRGALTPLGEGAGESLKKAIEIHGNTLGPVVIICFGFLSGVLATFCEPALLALGETVEKLTKGAFPKMKLVFAVALGVGSGIATGFAKIYFEWHLWPILLIGYSACLVLTYISDEAVACIAWDSAGVTTGPVTVPIVLASGLALGKIMEAPEGFGILSCASIGPILSVLTTGLMSKKSPAAGSGPVKEISLQEIHVSESSKRELIQS